MKKIINKEGILILSVVIIISNNNIIIDCSNTVTFKLDNNVFSIEHINEVIFFSSVIIAECLLTRNVHRLKTNDFSININQMNFLSLLIKKYGSYLVFVLKLEIIKCTRNSTQ